MEEIWKRHPQFKEYEISTLGRIRKYIRPHINSNGYAKVSIKHKSRSMHRLVAETFIPNPEKKPYVNHIDGVKHNNTLDNLEWVTPSENVRHAYMTGLIQMNKNVEKALADANEQRSIPVEFEGVKYRSINECARVTGYNAMTIKDWISKGKVKLCPKK